MKSYPIYKQTLNNGEELAFSQTGQRGPVLVLLHGNLSSSVHFYHLMEALEDSYRLIAIDMRGFGHSSYKNPVHSLQELAQDILELMEQLDIPRYSVLGWSTGGGVALEMAALRPETIDQVFLLSSVGIQGYLSPNKSNIAQFSLLPMLIQTNRAMAKWNPALQKVELALQQKDRRLLNKIMEPLYQLHPISETDYQIYMEAMCQQRNYSDIFINLFTFNMTNRHNGIQAGNNRIQLVECPLIIIHGDKDKVVRLDSALLTYQTKKEDSHLYVLDGGHSLLTDQAEQVQAIIRKHLT
ncbi:TPA: alpha/beta hydrolase [Streptococcus suis]|nr:alpha/beta hydrolase [Streptococcus suis]